MLDHDYEARRLLVREHAERLSDDMRRSCRRAPNEASYSGRASIGELLRRVARYRRTEESEARVTAHEPSTGPT
jgi:hypothetical protein